MQCDYFDAGRCRSCTHMGVPYPRQVADKQAHCAAVLAGVAPRARWEAPYTGPEERFRNKAKLVVGGRRGAVTLGILDAAGQGVDLRGCGLYEPALHAALPVLAGFVDATGLVPYDVPRRTGELKHLLVTCSPDAELMVRFVLRSEGQLGRLRRALPQLEAALAAAGPARLAVASANLHPTHAATLEGEQEVLLTERATLPMRLGGITLHLGVRSFFQTDTVVASALYAQAARWADASGAREVLDLYCGVGGFALHLAGPGRAVTGVEISPEAIASAGRSAREAGRLGINPLLADLFSGSYSHSKLYHPVLNQTTQPSILDKH